MACSGAPVSVKAAKPKKKKPFPPPARMLRRSVSAPNAGWIRYLQDTTLTLTSDKQTFNYDFEMTEKDDNNGRLEFNMGNKGSSATVYITNVRVEEIE